MLHVYGQTKLTRATFAFDVQCDLNKGQQLPAITADKGDNNNTNEYNNNNNNSNKRRITTTRGRTTITTAKHAKKPRKIGKLQDENKPHEPQAGSREREGNRGKERERQ